MQGKHRTCCVNILARFSLLALSSQALLESFKSFIHDHLLSTFQHLLRKIVYQIILFEYKHDCLKKNYRMLSTVSRNNFQASSIWFCLDFCLQGVGTEMGLTNLKINHVSLSNTLARIILDQIEILC